MWFLTIYQNYEFEKLINYLSAGCVVWLIEMLNHIVNLNQIVNCIENLSYLLACTCTYPEQVIAKTLEQKNKIVCPTNRYMFTNLLGLDDFMSRLASRLVVSFSFWTDEGHRRLYEISRSPRCWGGYGEIFQKFRVLAKFLKKLKSS